jgi:O-antigen ligase
MTEDEIRPSRPPRGPFVSLAALLLGLVGVIWLAYSGVAEIMPPVINQVNPPVAMAVGVVALIAAMGVFGLRPWGRWLGIALGIALLAQTAVTGSYAVGLAAGPGARDLALVVVVELLAPIVVAALILIGLVFRWPVTTDDATRTR